MCAVNHCYGQKLQVAWQIIVFCNCTSKTLDVKILIGNWLFLLPPLPTTKFASIQGCSQSYSSVSTRDAIIPSSGVLWHTVLLTYHVVWEAGDSAGNTGPLQQPDNSAVWVFKAIILCHFLQCSCCCLHSEGCNGNLPLHFFPGFMLISFAFDIKHGIIDSWEGFSCVFVMAAWSKDDMSVGKEEKRQLS